MFLANQLAAIDGYKFSNIIETAATDGQSIIVNENFWKSLNLTEQHMLLDHEIMHIVLGHHNRMTEHSIELRNYAADLSINGMLYDQYVGTEDPRIIIPTLYSLGQFPQKLGLPIGLSAEDYVNILKSRRERTPRNHIGMSVDSKGVKELAEKLASTGELPGENPTSDFDGELEKLKLKQKIPFSVFMKDLVGNNTFMNKMQLEERWGSNRRMPWASIPEERMTETSRGRARKNRIGLFLDFSGSCQKLLPMFCSASELVPRTHYIVSLYKFADTCEPIESVRSNVNVGSGTVFNSILQYQEGFDQIWVFTDGRGTITERNINHNNWRWFLSGDNLIPYGLPKNHKYYLLKDFIFQ